MLSSGIAKWSNWIGVCPVASRFHTDALVRVPEQRTATSSIAHKLTPWLISVMQVERLVRALRCRWRSTQVSVTCSNGLRKTTLQTARNNSRATTGTVHLVPMAVTLCHGWPICQDMPFRFWPIENLIEVKLLTIKTSLGQPVPRVH